MQDLGESAGRADEEERELKAGDQFFRRLDETSPMEEDHYFHSYRLTVPEGNSAVVRHNSEDFDALLLARWPNGNIQINDDYGDGTNSLLLLHGRNDGPYIIEFTSYNERGMGLYEAIVEMLSAPQVLLELKGHLTPASETDDEGRHYNEQFFSGVAGSSVAIELRSTDFDAYLYLYGPDGLLLAEDDDSLSDDGVDSMIFASLPENGTYRVIATGYSSDDCLGEFHLIVRQYTPVE